MSGGRLDVSTTMRADDRTRELTRRIEELEAQDEASFGHFLAWDWTICIALSLVLPLLGIWRCAA